MKAVLFPGDRRATVNELPDPHPGGNEVVIKVRASAICRSDMHLFYGDAHPGTTLGTIVPGHEAAGEVVEVGSSVHSVGVGDRVAVHLAFGCGHCEYCRLGYLMICPEWRCMGFDVNGGDAEYVAVPASNCLPIPNEMTFATAAVSTDMIGTQYSTQERLKVSGVGWLVVFGIGPMGAAAVMVGKARGARVVAVDPLQPRLDLAKELGADLTLVSSDSVAEQIMDHTGGGAAFAIDCSGNPSAQYQTLACLAKFGTAAFVGENDEVTINPSALILRKHATLTWGWYFPIWQYPKIASFIIDRQLPAEKMISHRFPLAQAAEAFRLFDERKAEKVIFDL